jgi:hypothetical protein
VKLLDLGIGPPSVRFEAIDQTTNQPVASNWAVNGLAPATGVWNAMAPTTNSSMSLLSVLPAALDKLGPGYYESRVDSTRADAGTTATRDVTTRMMTPNFDALPAAVNITTGVFHRQTIWMSGTQCLCFSAARFGLLHRLATAHEPGIRGVGSWVCQCFGPGGEMWHRARLFRPLSSSKHHPALQ